MQQLLTWDTQLFRLINNGLANSFFDAVTPWLRNTEFWVPLYLFLAIFMAYNFKSNGWLWILLFIITATVTDLVSSRLIKENIWRLRPCNDPALADWVRVVANRPQNSSFTSSHAANHFGAAAFIIYTLKPVWGKWVYLFYGWAAIVCLSQVYIGVHYPLDIIGGGVVGFLIGYALAKGFIRGWGLQQTVI